MKKEKQTELDLIISEKVFGKMKQIKDASELVTNEQYLVFEDGALFSRMVMQDDGFLAVPANRGQDVGFNPQLFLQHPSCKIYAAN